MPINLSTTAFQHSPDVQKEFERYARFANDLEERLEKLETPEEPKKEELYSLTVKHNNRIISKAKEVQAINFIDSDNIHYAINRKTNSNPAEVSKTAATEILVTPTASIDTCINDLLGLYQLLLAKTTVSMPTATTTSYKAIMCDNPGNHATGHKASDSNEAIFSSSFLPFPTMPTVGSPQYQLNPYRGIKFFNQCFDLNMGGIDNATGITVVRVPQTGLYKVSCVFTGQKDDGDTMEVHFNGTPANTNGETIVELLCMKNGSYHSMLNAMRIANKSVHLQGETLAFLEEGDEISIGFKAYEYTTVNQREVTLKWGTSTAPYISLYSHFIVEQLTTDIRTQTNSINTYAGEY